MASIGCDDSLSDRAILYAGKIESPVVIGPLDMSVAESATPMSIQSLSDSLIAITDSYEPVVALLSARTGKVVFSYNHKGRGPGELQSIGPLQLLSDSTILIPDPMQGRAIIWNFLSNSTSTTTLFNPAVPRNVIPSLVGYWGSHKWVMRNQPMAQVQGAAAQLFSTSSALVLTDSVSSKPLMQLPARALVAASTPSGVSRAGLGALSPAAFAMCDSGFINIDTSGVTRFSTTGTPLATHRHRLGWVPLQPAAKKAYINAAVSGVNDSRTRSEISAHLESQATRLNQLLVGFYIAPDGTVWMRSRTEKESAIVQVDDAGAPSRSIAVPQGIAVAQVGVGYFIGMRLSADAETPSFTLFSFTDDSARKRTRWRCGKQHDY
ncbi:hypothetical protein [Gemmatimonas sp.]|uniref:hypothetical protein n=1 Tax=Gemmatimonas sp. TaxID=1962908 RepID=UPI003341DE6D